MDPVPKIRREKVFIPPGKTIAEIQEKYGSLFEGILKTYGYEPG